MANAPTHVERVFKRSSLDPFDCGGAQQAPPVKRVRVPDRL
jgi:hypothetical protein